MELELSRGFVAFPRGLTDWEWYTDANTARVYFHLLLSANWSRKQWQGITIQPGQLVTSRAHLAQRLGLSEQQVRTALEHLKATGYLTIQTGPKYSILTLINYAQITGIPQLSNQLPTSNQPADNQPATTTLPSIPSEPELPSSSSPAGAEQTPTNPHSLIFEEYEANIGRLNATARKELAGYADRLGDAVVSAVLDKCARLGGHSWAYAAKALAEAEKLECRTAEEYRQLCPIGGSRSKGLRVDRTGPGGTDWLQAVPLDASLKRLRRKQT